jgi:glycolate oxidase iron-sulfur subunit
MQTALASDIRDTPQGREADRILRRCVHCGFCTATCPTYQLLGDELDGPRGRIYLIKALLEGQETSRKTQLHLDRCLSCRACETTCPSGVEYGRLLDIGRQRIDTQIGRPWPQRLLRSALIRVLPYPLRWAWAYRLADFLRPWLPRKARATIPPRRAHALKSAPSGQRKMIVLAGCVQSVVAPIINQAATEVFGRFGIALTAVRGAGCCGALSHHLDAHEAALNAARANIDAWWPLVTAGAEAIVITASGCGTQVKEYGYLLREDPRYRDRAARIGALAKDPSEVLAAEDLGRIKRTKRSSRRVAFQLPCSLQHGQRLAGVTEAILSRLGFTLTKIADPHLCCGSAGTYSLLQPDLSQRLLKNKLEALHADDPSVIATANVGCLLHLGAEATVPVRHWLEILAEETTMAAG